MLTCRASRSGAGNQQSHNKLDVGNICQSNAAGGNKLRESFSEKTYPNEYELLIAGI